MADQGTRPPPSRDVAGEDFLFHLYRGSELLQDNRVHDAKVELEQALSLQPQDSKGQDLLAIVYFRLGLYPRAIAIYQQLVIAHPDAIEPRINLALSYLKTGQPSQARAELERVLEQSPNHSRAWGYLGLAFQRLGDYERASHAFAAGGHETMARRLTEMIPPSVVAPSLRPEPVPAKDEARRVAREAFHEIDREGFKTDAEMRRVPSGTWSAIEPGKEAQGSGGGAFVPSLGNAMLDETTLTSGEESPSPPVAQVDGVHVDRGPLSAEMSSRLGASFTAAMSTSTPTSTSTSTSTSTATSTSTSTSTSASISRPASVYPPSSESMIARSIEPQSVTALLRDLLLLFPRERGVALHPSGVVLVQAETGFASRLDGLRALGAQGGLTTTAIQRRSRGRTLDEPLGGTASPIVEIAGRADLVLGPRAGQRLVPIALGAAEVMYLREDLVAGFELSLQFESGRLPVGDGDAIAMLQLRGPGAVVAELPSGREGDASRLRVSALEVTEQRSAMIRAISVLGWTGRLVPRALLASEAPAGARGLVAFSGEGMVFLDGR